MGPSAYSADGSRRNSQKRSINAVMGREVFIKHPMGNIELFKLFDIMKKMVRCIANLVLKCLIKK